MPQSLPPTLADYYADAQRAMTPENAAYFMGAAGDGVSAAYNETAFQHIQIIPRVLRDLSSGSTKISLLGDPLSSPIMVAPFAYQRLLNTDGEIATAIGAAAQDTPMIVSAQSSIKLPDIRTAAPQTNWFQLFWLGSRDATLALAMRAVDAGFNRFVFTVDAPVQGVRDREIQSGFRLPEDVNAINLIDLPQPRFTPLEPGESVCFDRVAHVLPNWDDVAWLCTTLECPVIIKGILHPDDAARAAQSGAAGVIISNHGGRVLDGAVSPIDMMAKVIDRVDPELPVLMDGGIRRGRDIFTALALGATAVLVGRPIVCGLAIGGAQGVAHVLRLLHDELEITMLLSGCRTIADISPDYIQRNR